MENQPQPDRWRKCAKWCTYIALFVPLPVVVITCFVWAIELPLIQTINSYAGRLLFLGGMICAMVGLFSTIKIREKPKVKLIFFASIALLMNTFGLSFGADIATWGVLGVLGFWLLLCIFGDF